MGADIQMTEQIELFCRCEFYTTEKLSLLVKKKRSERVVFNMSNNSLLYILLFDFLKFLKRRLK